MEVFNALEAEQQGRPAGLPLRTAGYLVAMQVGRGGEGRGGPAARGAVVMGLTGSARVHSVLRSDCGLQPTTSMQTSHHAPLLAAMCVHMQRIARAEHMRGHC